MSKKLYRIGEVSQILGISIQAIRLYQRKGLVEPEYVDDESNYRFYSQENIFEINKINVLQSAGFTLREIKEVGTISKSKLKDLVDRKKKELEYELEQKNIALRYLIKQSDALNLVDNRDINFTYKDIGDRFGLRLDILDDCEGEERIRAFANVKGQFGLNQEVSYQPSRILSIADNKVQLKYLMAINESKIIGKADDFTVHPGGRYICFYANKHKRMKSIVGEAIEMARQDGYKPRGDIVELLTLDESLTKCLDAYLREIQIALIEDK